MNKSKLRSKILKLREHYSDKSIRLNPKQIYDYLKNKNLNLKKVGGYYPSNYEIDDYEILNYFKKKGSVISFPVIKKKNQMDFFQWSFNSPLKVNKYGIPEPISDNKIYPDILFVPLVAFDKDLNRLGYGGGFYDRYIERVSKIKKIKKIGLAFSFQNLERIPVNQNDKKLDVIITEKDIF